MSSENEWRERINNGTIFSFDNYMYNKISGLEKSFGNFERTINILNSNIISNINPIDELKKLSNLIYLYLSSTFNALESGSNKIIRNVSEFETESYRGRKEISGFYLLKNLENSGRLENFNYNQQSSNSNINREIAGNNLNFNMNDQVIQKIVKKVEKIKKVRDNSKTGSNFLKNKMNRSPSHN